MRIPQKPANEAERLSALYEYNLLNTLPEKEYDNITKIASEICHAPISMITLIDNDKQFHKSRLGLDVTDIPRDHAFCSHAILNPKEIMEVNDSSKDERFHDNPYVLGDPNIAFYAGVPLVNESGHALGALCVIDHKPKSLSPEQKETLEALARQVVAQFELRRKNLQLEQQQKELKILNDELERFAYVAAHDLKSPCSNLAMLSGFLKDEYAEQLDAGGREMLDNLGTASSTLTRLIDGILLHTKTVNMPGVEKEHFIFGSLAADLMQVVDKPRSFTITVSNPEVQIYASRPALFQILLNLTVNAIKYNDKAEGNIHLQATDNGDRYTFSVTDNGPGIPPAHHEKIFELFTTLGRDKDGAKGNGIGLSTVKRLVHKYDGEITIQSDLGRGSTFSVTVKK